MVSFHAYDLAVGWLTDPTLSLGVQGRHCLCEDQIGRISEFKLPYILFGSKFAQCLQSYKNRAIFNG